MALVAPTLSNTVSDLITDLAATIGWVNAICSANGVISTTNNISTTQALSGNSASITNGISANSATITHGISGATIAASSSMTVSSVAVALSNVSISAGGIASGGGDLTTSRTITVTKAANTDIITGTDDTKAATSLALAYPLSLKVPSSRQVLTSGLATGGANLASDVTVTVPKAANTDIITGTDDTKAATSLALAYPLSLKVPSSRQVLTSGLATGGANLASDVTVTVPKAANTDVYTGTDDAKAVTSLAIKNAGVAFLGKTAQVIAGGAVVTPASLTTGNITVDSGLAPLQYITNGGLFTITAPSNDGSCVLLVTNNSSAGAITFIGFSVGSSTGDALTTANTSKFMIYIVRINGVSTYSIKALQ